MLILRSHFVFAQDRCTHARVLDPIRNVMRIFNRREVCEMIDGMPPYIVVDADCSVEPAELEAAGIMFPVLAKPILAHGSKESHRIGLVFNEAGLSDIGGPCIVQQ